MSTSVGELLAGRYRLLRVLGRGGMGAVWAAHDELLGRDVAVKEVAPPAGQPGESPDQLRRRALREARAAARVGHPCAVTVFDVSEDADRHWIVMELLPQRTLADELARQGRLAPVEAARIGLDLLDALASAHAAGVLHRDVKPSNVLLSDGRAVLADFGIATLDGDAPALEHGLVVGSPAYMAPERARGEAPSPAVDLWSLGATLYTAVEGRPPFWRDAPLPTLTAVLHEEPPTAEHAGPLGAVLAALLARDPAARPDVALTRRLLLGVLAGPSAVPADATAVLPVLPAPAPVEPRTPADVAAAVEALDDTRQVPRPRRRTAPLAMAACAAAALLGVGGALGHSLGFGAPDAGSGVAAVLTPGPVRPPAPTPATTTPTTTTPTVRATPARTTTPVTRTVAVGRTATLVGASRDESRGEHPAKARPDRTHPAKAKAGHKKTGKSKKENGKHGH